MFYIWILILIFVDLNNCTLKNIHIWIREVKKKIFNIVTYRPFYSCLKYEILSVIINTIHIEYVWIVFFRPKRKTPTCRLIIFTYLERGLLHSYFVHKKRSCFFKCNKTLTFFRPIMIFYRLSNLIFIFHFDYYF